MRRRSLCALRTMRAGIRWEITGRTRGKREERRGEGSVLSWRSSVERLPSTGERYENNIKTNKKKKNKIQQSTTKQDNKERYQRKQNKNT